MLVALIFLLLVGGLLLAAMAYLYNTADTGQSLQNSGAQAFIAAESGDQYGVYYLETTYVAKFPPNAPAVPPQNPVPNPSCPPTVTVTRVKGGGKNYLVQSTAKCPSSGAQWTIDRVVQAARKNGRVTYTVSAWTEQ